MYGLKDLKSYIKITTSEVECPVNKCNKTVARQKRRFKKEVKFMCSKHNIYISPSTFEYGSECKNILWHSQEDMTLLKAIKKVKRVNRFAREKSEDAVTWNVFRFLEKNDLLNGYLSKIINENENEKVSNSEIIYWSYSQSHKGIWKHLETARKKFETSPKNGTEPDLIIKSDKYLFFIEAKFDSNNNTISKSKSKKVSDKYTIGGECWFKKIFKCDFNKIAKEEKKYELLRLWLLGSWLAKELKLDFYLFNLVLNKKEKDIENTFKQFICENNDRKFKRITWEDIYHHILSNNSACKDANTIKCYLKNKTLGYKNGKLKKAFSI